MATPVLVAANSCFHMCERLETQKTAMRFCMCFRLFPLLSFPHSHVFTQTPQLLTQTILEIKKHTLNADNAFFKKVVDTHSIFYA